MTETEATGRKAGGRGCPDPAVLHTMSLAAPEPVPAHVDDCSRCRARWREATTLSGVLETEATELFPFDCPDETQWSVAAESGLTAELAAHLDRCVRCGELWSYLRRAGFRASRASPRHWRLRHWAAVASLLVGVLLWARPWSPVPSASEVIIRGPSVRLEAAAEHRPDGDVLLRWSPDAVAERYRLRIWSEDGRLLLQEELSGTVRRLEMSTLAGWSSTLLWQVQALEAGRELGGTPVRRLSAPEAATNGGRPR